MVYSVTLQPNIPKSVDAMYVWKAKIDKSRNIFLEPEWTTATLFGCLTPPWLVKHTRPKNRINPPS